MKPELDYSTPFPWLIVAGVVLMALSPLFPSLCRYLHRHGKFILVFLAVLVAPIVLTYGLRWMAQSPVRMAILGGSILVAFWMLVAWAIADAATRKDR